MKKLATEKQLSFMFSLIKRKKIDFQPNRLMNIHHASTLITYLIAMPEYSHGELIGENGEAVLCEECEATLTLDTLDEDYVGCCVSCANYERMETRARREHTY